MTRGAEAKQMAFDACMEAASHLADETFLAHPLPWNGALSAEIEKQVVEGFDIALAGYPVVTETVEAASLRQAALMAFRDRLEVLAAAGRMEGHA